MRSLKFITVLLFFLSLYSNGNAQDEKNYFAICIGPSTPFGDLASKDPDNDAAGWANSGAIFDLTYARKLGDGNFGINILLRGQANPTDAQAFVDQIAYQYPNIFWTVESDAWGIGGFMVGGFGTLPVSDKVNFEPRLMMGFMTATSPAITVTGTNAQGTASAWIKQESSPAASLTGLLGVGFRYDLGEHFCLFTNLDCMFANPEFVNVEQISSFGTRDLNTFNQSITSINLGLGVGLRW